MVNVVNLMALAPQAEHPNGLDDREFDALFTTDTLVVWWSRWAASTQTVERVLEVLRTRALPAPTAVGHRIVHGGPRLRQHALPQVVCLDTRFHADMPAVAQVLPRAKSLRDSGIQRYGFHGLSCASIVRALADELPVRVVIAHLGSGVSLTAVLHGQSSDTSLRLTPAGGVLMATRSGDLDPGILLYLLR